MLSIDGDLSFVATPSLSDEFLQTFDVSRGLDVAG